MPSAWVYKTVLRAAYKKSIAGLHAVNHSLLVERPNTLVQHVNNYMPKTGPA
jgi:hypothetical protein